MYLGRTTSGSWQFAKGLWITAGGIPLRIMQDCLYMVFRKGPYRIVRGIDIDYKRCLEHFLPLYDNFEFWSFFGLELAV